MSTHKHSEADIIIIGLGPGNPEWLTRQAWEILKSAGEIYLRTRQHPVTAGLPSTLTQYSFDNCYQEEDSFPDVYRRICEEIIRLGKRENGVLYGVPGDPWVSEATTGMILERAAEENLTAVVVPGLSFLEPTFASLGIDPLPQITLADAEELVEAYFPPFPPDTPVLIGQVYSRLVASHLKLVLMEVYPDEHDIILVHDAGLPGQSLEALPLYELDRSPRIGLRTSLYLPPLEEGSSLESFQEIIARLRAPGGCPWDREQDHQSLRPNLLEETYEALAAIDADDPQAMAEEFGDLLLQIVLQAQIASEYGEFTMRDVVWGIYTKIVHRHPHVFEDLDLEGAREVIANWEKLKAEERREQGNESKGLLDGVPLDLPALSQAETYQRRAARVGFDWKELEGVLEKITEEVGEFQAADNKEEQVAELGDLLFAVVNLARWRGIDAESALREANLRFRSRFRWLEQKARGRGRELSDMSLEELDQLWEEAKQGAS